MLVGGTAGSGKSASLMSLALKLSARGISVAWMDRESEMTASGVRRAMRGRKAPKVLVVDDASMFGGELAPLVRDVTSGGPQPLVVLAVRTSRAERLLNPALLPGIPRVDIMMPPLADGDIEGLLGLLTRENRLGILKGRSKEQQIAAFRDQAGRQLLVAMLQATSGRRFEEKAIDELFDLEGDERQIYCLVAIASAFRFTLDRSDILIAFGERSNAALNALEALVGKHIISRIADAGSVRARHHVIAEVLRDELVRRGMLGAIVAGLTLAMAAKVRPAMSRTAAPRRFLRRLIDHRFLVRAVSVEGARNMYGEFEQLLTWDFHYWLQRGSLEVKFGDLRLAENFLNQARSLSPRDALVETEYAYLLFRQAIDTPAAVEAAEIVDRATAALEDLIVHRGARDPYPYHVLGSQGLSWTRRGILAKDDRADYLRKLLALLEDGCARHPAETDLQRLRGDVQQELLSIAVPEGRR